MKVIFAGTPAFAATALDALLLAGFDIPLVLTQPDRPAGRGMKQNTSAVAQLALKKAIPVLQPASLRLNGAHGAAAKETLDRIDRIKPDVMIVVAYGLILPGVFLQLPPFGCLNIHASLLPRWRGAAPIQRAIEAGDNETGITIMQMDEGLDTGPILLQKSLPVASDDTAASLHDKLAVMGGDMICEALKTLKRTSLPKREQDATRASYAAKIMKNEASLDFSLPAEVVANKIRAFNPFPGAQAILGDTAVKIWRAEALSEPLSQQPAGKVIAASARHGVLVACGSGVLRVTEMQKPGGKRLPAPEFISGFPLDGRRFS